MEGTAAERRSDAGREGVTMVGRPSVVGKGRGEYISGATKKVGRKFKTMSKKRKLRVTCREKDKEIRMINDGVIL